MQHGQAKLTALAELGSEGQVGSLKVEVVVGWRWRRGGGGGGRWRWWGGGGGGGGGAGEAHPSGSSALYILSSVLSVAFLPAFLKASFFQFTNQLDNSFFYSEYEIAKC